MSQYPTQPQCFDGLERLSERKSGEAAQVFHYGDLGAWERPSDPTSTLIQMGARSYDPALGAFASEDSVLGHLGISGVAGAKIGGGIGTLGGCGVGVIAGLLG